MTAYKGRLAWDSDLGVHVGEDGQPVVTEDAGRTWRLAKTGKGGALAEGELSHVERYQERIATVDSTANEHAALAFEHGRVRADELMAERAPHHFEPTPDDAHAAGVRADPDHVAEKATSHTEAWQ